jgi:predicted metal-binding protein
MGTTLGPIDVQAPGLNTYRAPWKGQIVLVCRKCERKMKHAGKQSSLAKLAKLLKKRTKHNEEGQRLRVVEVACMKMCPKGGVTVCTQQQLSRHECCIVRTKADVEALVASTSVNTQ